MVAVMLVLADEPALAWLLAAGWLSSQMSYWTDHVSALSALDFGSMVLVAIMQRNAPSTSKVVVLSCYLSMLYLHTVKGALGYEMYVRALNALFVTQLTAAGWSGGCGMGRYLRTRWHDLAFRRGRRVCAFESA